MWGVLVIIGDVGKGAVASMTGKALAGDDGAYAAGAAAVCGHCYPAWNGLRGGKGVATSFGTTFVCMPGYAPIDVAVAVGSFAVAQRVRPGPRMDAGTPARAGTFAASAAFTVTAVLARLLRWRPLWSPRPTVLLPVYAIVSSAIIFARFLTAGEPRERDR